MDRPKSLLLVLPLLLLGACGGGGDPTELTNEGSQALASGNAQQALDCFAGALEGLDRADPLYKRARLGEVEAKILVNPDAAKASFLVYATESPEQLDARDYHKVGTKLSDKNALLAAVEVLGAGLKRFPGDAKIDEALELTQAAAQRSGDTSALDALKGLGYAGGGDK